MYLGGMILDHFSVRRGEITGPTLVLRVSRPLKTSLLIGQIHGQSSTVFSCLKKKIMYQSINVFCKQIIFP